MSIELPESLASIGNYAFSYNSALTSIVIPEGVTKIGEFAFNNCKNLTAVTIPDSVTSIGKSAFSGCSPELLIQVGFGSYAESYCMKIGLNYKTNDDTYGDAPTDWLKH